MKEKFSAFVLSVDIDKYNFDLIHKCAKLPFLDDKVAFQEIELFNFEEFHIEVASPNMIQLFIENAKESDLKAKTISEEITLEQKKLHDFDIEQKIRINTSLVYQYIGAKTNSIINSYQAVEAFCNFVIPDDYIYTKTNKRSTENYNKMQIERFISTGEKLNKIICTNLYNIQNIDKQDEWKEYLKLENIRHAIIHQKSKESKSLINELLICNKKEFYKTTQNIIELIVSDILKNFEKYDKNIIDKLPQFQDIKVLLNKSIGWENWDKNKAIKDAEHLQ